VPRDIAAGQTQLVLSVENMLRTNENYWRFNATPLWYRVATRLRDREVAKRLRAEASAEAAHAILTTDSWRGRDPQPDWKHAA